VLAAHGSDADPQVNENVRQVAVRIAVTGAFDELATAFHRGEPSFSNVLDSMKSEIVTVVPFMTSGGYFCDAVLPEELARNARFSNMQVRVAPPVGSDRRVADFATKRVGHLASEHSLPLKETSVLVVGHGSRRHVDSRRTTWEMARTIGTNSDVVEVLPCFLDDRPSILDAVRQARGEHLIAIVFLLTSGSHAVCDVPRALGLTPTATSTPPFAGHVAGRFVVCDAPLGTLPKFADLVVELAREASFLTEVA